MPYPTLNASTVYQDPIFTTRFKRTWGKLVTGSPSPIGGRETSIAELAHFFPTKILMSIQKIQILYLKKVFMGKNKFIGFSSNCYCQSSPLSFHQFLQRLTIIKIEVFVLDAGSRMYMMMVSHTSGRVEENEWVFWCLQVAFWRLETCLCTLQPCTPYTASLMILESKIKFVLFYLFISYWIGQLFMQIASQIVKLSLVSFLSD